MLRELDENWVNCWLLAKELDAIARASGDPELEKLCALVRQNYKYPVDTVLIDPAMRVIGHKNANDASMEGAAEYARFLKRARGARELGPQPAAEQARERARAPEASKPREKALVLAPGDARGALLDVFKVKKRSAIAGFYRVDVSAFPRGTLRIACRVGLSGAEASFELCEILRVDGGAHALRPISRSDRARAGAPVELVHTFEEGKSVYIGVRAHGEPGASGALALDARVTEAEEPAPEKAKREASRRSPEAAPPKSRRLP